MNRLNKLISYLINMQSETVSNLQRAIYSSNMQHVASTHLSVLHRELHPLRHTEHNQNAEYVG